MAIAKMPNSIGMPVNGLRWPKLECVRDRELHSQYCLLKLSPTAKVQPSLAVQVLSTKEYGNNALHRATDFGLDAMDRLAQYFSIGYFNWTLVVAYVVLVGIFLFGLLRPRQPTEWRSAGVAQAWVIALYAEMYGVPLTAYLAMNWLGRSQAAAENHFNGHLWPVLLGFQGEQLVTAQFWFTLVGQFMILIGGLIALIGWRQLYRAAKDGKMATGGLYRWIRHPQYTGFFLFLFGSMINWPTLITMLTLPLLCYVYWRLALSEEQDALGQFGDRYRAYMNSTGRFFPKLT